MIVKRLFDFGAAAVGLCILFPAFLCIALWIKCDSPGPVFFRQLRVGKGGKSFLIHKFRTMFVDSNAAGLQITVDHDNRITRSGKWLRKYKIDELPQLIDVLYGSMSLVGPRPEVPRYVDVYPPALKREILSIRPGITDYASIYFKNESEMLSTSGDPEKTYVEKILPIKLAYYEKYVGSQSLKIDLLIIFKTLMAIFIARKENDEK